MWANAWGKKWKQKIVVLYCSGCYAHYRARKEWAKVGGWSVSTIFYYRNGSFCISILLEPVFYLLNASQSWRTKRYKCRFCGQKVALAPLQNLWAALHLVFNRYVMMANLTYFQFGLFLGWQIILQVSIDRQKLSGAPLSAHFTQKSCAHITSQTQEVRTCVHFCRSPKLLSTAQLSAHFWKHLALKSALTLAGFGSILLIDGRCKID